GVVIRADRARIRIGARSNVQDNAIFHADPGAPVDLGADVTVGHGAIVHGATVEDGCLVGMGSTLLNNAVVGAGSLVAASALVREGQAIPPGSMVAGVPAKVLGPVPDGFAERVAFSVAAYEQLRDEHREGTGEATQ
ncbi:MAG: gamma carbonic anhydrase family protein, partial [Candidatus Phosphoribacter baldrii]